MADGPSSELKFEIGHVLFIDIVGYSKLLISEQSEQIQKLRAIVRGTEQFRLAKSEGKLLGLPTGDGGALVFRTNPEAPVFCAMEISKELKRHPELQVRMGIHSGPVNEITDLNEQANIAGAGINIAQRVMDCGDAGHILLSRHVAEDLEQYPRWQPYLHELGDCEIKHGMRIGIVNVANHEVGNAQVPKKFQALQKHRARVRRATLTAAVLLLGAIVAGTFFVSRYPTHSVLAVVEKSIAVLPFENLSEEKQNEYFADGVQDEILTDLAKIADLKVISRTSVMRYKNRAAARNLREIGQQLGVAHVVEGSVQRAANKIRVNAQLIDARNDAHLWAQTYDRDLADVFAIQSEIAEQIVSQLKSELSPQEKAAIEEKPTSNLAAYDLYTRARILIEQAVFSQFSQGNDLTEAIHLLEEALKRDPSFALAYYQLAHAHDQLYWRQIDRTPERLTLADTAIKTLQRLRPNSPESHLAWAKHLYWGYLDFDHARRELEAAQKGLPNNSECVLLLGYIERRQGGWEDSIREMERARELDPRNVVIPKQIALSYRLMRHYADQRIFLDRALQLAPNDLSAQIFRARVELEEHANTKALHNVLVAFLEKEPNQPEKFGDDLIDLALFERDSEISAAAVSALAHGLTYGVESISFPRGWAEGRIARARGDSASEKSSFTEARAALSKALEQNPNDAPSLMAAALADAMLGQGREAVHEARRAVELLPVSKDAVDGALFLEYLAAVYTTVGKPNDAINQLNSASKIPSQVNYGELKLDPIWDPLRGDSRFEKIVASLAPK
jgi:TolB-like protein/lipopolysaccharide biosynthesis regulator YciM